MVNLGAPNSRSHLHTSLRMFIRLHVEETCKSVSSIITKLAPVCGEQLSELEVDG